jgi:indole-3-glycerol phosphate synthase
MDILSKIIANKLIEIKQAKKKVALEDLIKKIKTLSKPRDFKKAISKKNKLCIIAEIKKASPSQGIIRRDFSAVNLAKTLEKSGADALSVLTDKKFFKGDISYIKKIKSRVKLPILRKDFIIDEYQVYESRVSGADAILLITGLLSVSKLKKFYILARNLGMNCIVEVHNRADLNKALSIKPDIIGINNRNLRTFKVDLSLSTKLKLLIPQGIITISESGIKDFECTKQLRKMGFNSALIGEAFMRMEAISTKLK